MAHRLRVIGSSYEAVRGLLSLVGFVGAVGPSAARGKGT